MNQEIARIEAALAEARFETARRRCLAALDAAPDAGQRNALLKQLHRAYRALGDFKGATEALAQIQPADEREQLEVVLSRASDLHHFSTYTFFRDSDEARAGLTGEEYEDKYEALSDLSFREAVALARTEEDKLTVAKILARAKRKAWAKEIAPNFAYRNGNSGPAKGEETETGVVSGSLRWPGGGPVTGVQVILGLADSAIHPDHGEPSNDPNAEVRRPGQSLTALTNENGGFHFENVAIGRHEFLAVTLDPAAHEIVTRFLLHGVGVQSGENEPLELVVDEWRSAEPAPVAHSFWPERESGGFRYRLLRLETWKNPFDYDFPNQAVELPLPEDWDGDPGRLLVLDSDAPDQPLPFQVTGEQALVFTALPAYSQRALAVYETISGEAEPFLLADELTLQADEDGATAVIDTGRVQFRIPWEGAATLPPILALHGEDGVWRGAGRFALPEGVTIDARETEVLEQGPLLLRVRIAYEFSNGLNWSVTWTAHAGETYLLAHEVSPPFDGAAFEFSLRDLVNSSDAGRGYLHWSPEDGSVHWTTIRAIPKELARLQEQTPWWIPPQGFGYAFTADGLEQKDYVGVFTIRRGEWIDREFARLSKGPVQADGSPNWELDWPFPEMMGSTISMITAHTDATGDAFFRFGCFDGERHWGILASAQERNDGPFKEIASVQHKTSSPRLQEYKDWHLDEQDSHARPLVVAKREELRELREKRNQPRFARLWNQLGEKRRFGAVDGLRFAIDGDPWLAWRKRNQLLKEAHDRSRNTLLGRDYNDQYSPVGGRPITPFAEEYDLIAASGVFTPDEERLVRSFLMLMGHMYALPDFMNWRFNSRNANFEADRVDVVGAIGLCFLGNPDSGAFIEHAIARLAESLLVYCNPDSGKWYENPSCYYLHAAKCYMNLLFHMVHHGYCDPAKLPRLRQFLSWSVLMLVPPTPPSYEVMRNGLSDAEYRAADKVRRVAPIGDHAHLGPWVPDFCGFMSPLFRESDPELANLLMWAYQVGAEDGGYYGNIPLIFAALNEADFQLPDGYDPEPALASRRLEGFGAVMRSHFGEENEGYVLVKQGPGGYRYHRTEGSFIYFEDGKPLVYDGGEGGETWRHSTLSFHDVHMPLSAGRVERFHSNPALDFVQGIHPVILNPGDPVFLSDNCHHDLVKVAYARAATTEPAVSRSFFWAKDEYLVVHDDLRYQGDIPSHWHLQVMAHGETGDPEAGFCFAGRFGLDLQVLFPDQKFAGHSVNRQPILDYFHTPDESFAMRHLQLTGDQPDHYLAVLRPLTAGKGPVNASALTHEGRTIGVRVWNEEIDDLLFFNWDGMDYAQEDVRFEGRYGAVLRRPGGTHYILLDGTHVDAPAAAARK